MPNAELLKKLFGVRVGDHRILYEVDYNGNLIGIVKFQFVLIATVFFQQGFIRLFIQLGLGDKLL
jgi:hypothetical protein